MRTLQEKYNAITEGNFSKEQFRRDAIMQLPNLVSKFNSFEDMSTILKNRGVIAEAKTQEPKYTTASAADSIAPDVLDTGIKFELDKKYGTLDVTPEQYAKCREMAIKNLANDILHYVKQDSIQLETPGEKMEKAKLNEETDVLFERNLKASEVWRTLIGKNKKVVHKGAHTYKWTVPSSEEIKTMVDEKGYGDVLINSVEFIGTSQGDYSLANATPDQAAEFKAILDPSDDLTPAIIGAIKDRIYKSGSEHHKEESDMVAPQTWKDHLKNLKWDIENGTTKMMKQAGMMEEFQNIESDKQTRKRIAGLTNQLLQDADPGDSREYATVKAYAISVKNDLESGDTSRMTKYKKVNDIPSLQALKARSVELEEGLGQAVVLTDKDHENLMKNGSVAVNVGGQTIIVALKNFDVDMEDDDMEHYLTHDVDQLEEAEGDTIELSAEDMEKLHKNGKVTLPDGSVLHFVGKAEAGVTYPEDKHTLTPDELGYDVDEAKTLKEAIKKIIAKVITE